MQAHPFSADEIEEIHRAVKKKYMQVSRSAAGFFTYPVGKAGAKALGYDAVLVENMNDEFVSSFCGVGNPFSLGTIEQGDILLDIGCGAGFDLFVASRLTGRKGKVIGVDLTADMVHRARVNLESLGVDNAEVTQISNSKLPFDDDSFDIVISNGAINLSPEKRILFEEIFRVLRSGGRLQIADIVLDKELPPHLASSIESWAQ